jgi:hypothetical protein
MAKRTSEYKSLLESFTRLATNYCDNALKLAADADQRKIIGAYKTGLEAAVHHTFALLQEYYDGSDARFQAQIDTYIQATGMRPMLDAAAKVVGPRSLETVDGLDKSRHFFEKAKGALGGIPGLLISMLPFAGAVPQLLHGIDNIIDNIAEALKPGDAGGPKTVERPPPVPHAEITGCTWHVIYEGKDAATYQLNHINSRVDGKETDQAAQKGQVEVRVDGKVVDGDVNAFMKKFTGKKIEVHYKSDAKNSAYVSYKPL